MDIPKIFLKTKKDQSLRRLHPWVFSGAIKKMEGMPQGGDLVEVLSNHGEFLGIGHYSPGSIAVRIISFENIEPGVDFWLDKLRNAYETRQTIGLTDNENTDIYRLVHAEGDGLPGLIIDMYAGNAVVQTHSIGMHYMRDLIVEGLKGLFGDKLNSVYDKSAKTLAKNGGFVSEDGYLFGSGDGPVKALEFGCAYDIDWVHGQKTGFFIDQRENRYLLGQYSKGAKVLNTFCYSGGFSIAALKMGAKEVHSLDSSQGALDLVTENIKLNELEHVPHKNIKADAVEYLKNIEKDYDIVVLDPPAFAKHQSARHKAVQGYKRLNAHAIQQIKPGGLIFTFSCSQAVDKTLFTNTVVAAAISVGRKVRILHQLHQPADHPVNIYHPESEYLKGLVIKVD